MVDFIGWVQSGVQNAVNTVVNTVQAAPTVVSSAAGNVINTGSQIVQNGGAVIGNTITQAGNAIGNTYNQGIQNVSSGIQNVSSGLQYTVANPVQAIQNIPSMAISGIGAVGSGIQNLPSTIGWGIQNIPNVIGFGGGVTALSNGVAVGGTTYPSPFLSSIAATPQNMSGPAYTNQQIQQFGPANPGMTLYAAASNRAQTEVKNLNSIIYDPVGGSFEGSVIPFGHSISNIVTSGGAGALQSGRFTLTPATPIIYTQEGTYDKVYAPTAHLEEAAAVLANPDAYSRLGAEAYGGTVQLLDGRTLGTAAMGVYPASAGNLANLVSPTGVNQSKSTWAELPWNPPVMSTPGIYKINSPGVIGEWLTPISTTERASVGLGPAITTIPTIPTLTMGGDFVSSGSPKEMNILERSNNWLLGLTGMGVQGLEQKGTPSIGGPPIPPTPIGGAPLPPGITGTAYEQRTDPLAVALEGAVYFGDQLLFGLATPGSDLLTKYGQNTKEGQKYGAFSDWNASVSQSLRGGTTEQQITAYEQSQTFKESGTFNQFGEGAWKAMTNPAGLAGAALQGVEIYAGMGVASAGLTYLAGPAAAGAGGVAATPASLWQTIGATGLRTLESPTFAVGTGLVFAGLGVYSATEGFTAPRERSISNLGGMTINLAASGVAIGILEPRMITSTVGEMTPYRIRISEANIAPSSGEGGILSSYKTLGVSKVSGSSGQIEEITTLLGGVKTTPEGSSLFLGSPKVRAGEFAFAEDAWGNTPTFAPKTPLETHIVKTLAPEEAGKIQLGIEVRKTTSGSGLELQEVTPAVKNVMESYEIPHVDRVSTAMVDVMKEYGVRLYGSTIQRGAGAEVGQVSLGRLANDLDVMVPGRAGAQQSGPFAESMVKAINREAGGNFVTIDRSGAVETIKIGNTKLFDIHNEQASVAEFLAQGSNPLLSTSAADYVGLGMKTELPVMTKEGVPVISYSEQMGRKLTGTIEYTPEARVVVGKEPKLLPGQEPVQPISVEGRIAPRFEGRMKDIGDYYFGERANINVMEMSDTYVTRASARGAKTNLESWLDTWGKETSQSVRSEYQIRTNEGTTRPISIDFNEIPIIQTEAALSVRATSIAAATPSAVYELMSPANFISPRVSALSQTSVISGSESTPAFSYPSASGILPSTKSGAYSVASSDISPSPSPSPSLSIASSPLSPSPSQSMPSYPVSPSSSPYPTSSPYPEISPPSSPFVESPPSPPWEPSPGIAPPVSPPSNIFTPPPITPSPPFAPPSHSPSPPPPPPETVIPNLPRWPNLGGGGGSLPAMKGPRYKQIETFYLGPKNLKGLMMGKAPKMPKLKRK